jgi:flagellar biosynthesis chaperone FliJ
MTRVCHGRFKKAENKKKNWKETDKDRKTWRDLAERAKTQKCL